MEHPPNTTKNGTHQQIGPEPPPRANSSATVAQRLLELTHNWDLFHDAHGTPYASFPRDRHQETWPINSSAIADYLTSAFLRASGRAPDERALKTVTRTLVARARFENPERKTARRIAQHGDSIYLDLCDAHWRTVRIDAEGWRLCERSPVRFVRFPGMLAIPEPTRGASVHALRNFINIENDDHWMLVLAWLVAAFRPIGPYPILLMCGGEGTAKSTTTRILRALVDPNEAPLRSLPRDEHDLAIAGTNSWVMAFDNVSKLPPWLSDALCRVATGGGFVTRQLYTNDEEARFSVQRPILMNGIVQFAEREDFLSRTVAITLDRISDERRRSENELWTAFEAARQPILGALLEAVACALRKLPSVQETRPLPRMADFAQWVMAAEEALGGMPGAFMAAYERNRDASADEILNSDSLACVLLALLETKCEWRGTPNDLFHEVTLLRLADGLPPDWPKTPRGLSSALERRAAVLARAGIELERLPRSHQGRIIVLRRRPCGDGIGSAEVA